MLKGNVIQVYRAVLWESVTERKWDEIHYIIASLIKGFHLGNLRKNVKFPLFGDRMEKKHFIFIIDALKYRSSHSSKVPQNLSDRKSRKNLLAFLGPFKE